MPEILGGAHRLGDCDDYRIVKKIYENILDEDMVKECGRELYDKGGTREMTRCKMLWFDGFDRPSHLQPRRQQQQI